MKTIYSKNKNKHDMYGSANGFKGGDRSPLEVNLRKSAECSFFILYIKELRTKDLQQKLEM